MTSNLVTRYITIVFVLALAGLSISLNWPIKYGIDLSGGSILTYRVESIDTQAGQATQTISGEDVDDTVSVISERINSAGTVDIQVRREGSDRIAISIPRATEQETKLIRERMTQVGSLEFTIQAEDGDEAHGRTFKKEAFDTARLADLKAKGTHTPPLGFRWFPSRPERLPNQSLEDFKKSVLDYQEQVRTDIASVPGEWMYYSPRYWDANDPSMGFTGKDIYDASRSTDDKGGRAVAYKVKEYKQAAFRSYTKTFLNRTMALVLNKEVWSSANIGAVLSDNVQIFRGNGGYSEDEQTWILSCLKSGSLKLRPVLESQDQIGATLGAVAVQRGKWAFSIGMIFVVIFMIFYYRTAGIFAVTALALNFVLVFGVLMLLEASLTLPGLAGLVLTVGMAVDANILIFERIREELQKGKKLAHAAKNGFDRAFVTIFDANLTTFIVAAFLVQFGKGPIKGFGYTMMTGIVCSMFAALYITRTLLGSLIARGTIDDLKFMEVVKNPNIAFTAKAGKALKISAVVIALGMVGFFISGDSKYGLDFNGGTSARLECSELVSAKEIEERIGSIKNEDGKKKYNEFGVTLVDPEGNKSRTIDLKLDFVPSKSIASGNDGSDQFDIIQTELKTALTGLLVPDALTEQNFDASAGTWSTVVNLEKGETDQSVIQSILDDAGLTNSSLLRVGDDGKAWRISCTASEESIDSTKEKVINAFDQQEKVAVSNPFPKVRYLGPAVVADLKTSAIQAMIMSLFFILGYIWFRFRELKYGFAAAAALVHDVLISLGMVVLINLSGIIDVPITLDVIAGFLTIIGYSLNDTIVVFDRIRENLGNTRGSFGEVVNRSINQTLSRTILTSITTFVVIAVVFIFNLGQESPLLGLSLTLMIGVVVGTYSSIFVASPVLVWAHNRDLEKAEKTPAKAKTA